MEESSTSMNRTKNGVIYLFGILHASPTLAADRLVNAMITTRITMRLVFARLSTIALMPRCLINTFVC